MAKFRGRRPRRGPLPFRYVLLLTLVIFIILSASSFWIVNEKVEDTLMHIATLEASSVATTIIQEAVKDEIISEEEAKVLVSQSIDESGDINSTNFNTRTVSAALRRVTDNITAKLEEIEKGNFHDTNPNSNQELELDDGIVYAIPLGQITDNAILSTLGPNIPVRFYLIGDVHTDIERKIVEYGINNAVHKFSIFVEVKVQVVIPFATKTTTITNTIPIIDYDVQGDVPQYYNESGENSPAIELPKVP
ncbi:MAG: sporulation protein YunB [Bacillota bacterium]